MDWTTTSVWGYQHIKRETKLELKHLLKSNLTDILVLEIIFVTVIPFVLGV
jgi:hypothetical protein